MSLYFIDNFKEYAKKTDSMKLQIGNIPKVSKAVSVCLKAEKVLNKIKERSSLLEEYKSVKKNKLIMSAKISKTSNYRKALSLLEDVLGALSSRPCERRPKGRECRCPRE